MYADTQTNTSETCGNISMIWRVTFSVARCQYDGLRAVYYIIVCPMALGHNPHQCRGAMLFVEGELSTVACIIMLRLAGAASWMRVLDNIEQCIYKTKAWQGFSMKWEQAQWSMPETHIAGDGTTVINNMTRTRGVTGKGYLSSLLFMVLL